MTPHNGLLVSATPLLTGPLVRLRVPNLGERPCPRRLEVCAAATLGCEADADALWVGHVPYLDPDARARRHAEPRPTSARFRGPGRGAGRAGGARQHQPTAGLDGRALECHPCLAERVSREPMQARAAGPPRRRGGSGPAPLLRAAGHRLGVLRPRVTRSRRGSGSRRAARSTGRPASAVRRTVCVRRRARRR